MDSVIAKAKELAIGANEAGRTQLLHQLRELTYSLESEDDIIQRLMYRPLELTVVKIGVDLKIFEFVAASESPVTLDHLRKETGASKVLLGRILRYLASFNLIKETGVDTFTSTNATKALANPANQAGIIHQSDTIGPMWAELPGLLQVSKFQDMNDSNHTCFHAWQKTDESIFAWMGQHPTVAGNFGQWITHYMSHQQFWLPSFPIQKEIGTWQAKTDDEVLLVDVGSNLGPLLEPFKMMTNGIRGRIVLQKRGEGSNTRSEIDQTHDAATASDGLKTAVETTFHDIFTPQPIKGAKFYYLKGLIHELPDDKAESVLKNLVQALGPDSVILIDEKIFPDSHVDWKMTQLDISMMACFSSIERTEAMWNALLHSVGLKIARKHMHGPESYDGVLVVTKQ